MRSRCFTVATLAFLVSGCGGDAGGPEGAVTAARLACPAGTQAMEWTQADASVIRWCERPDGVVEGPYEARDAAGALFTAGSFVADLADGEWRWYYDGGALALVGTYHGGVPDGRFVKTDPGGAVLYEHTFVAGAPCGAWTDFGATTAYPACDGGPCGAAERTAAACYWDGASCPSGTLETDPLDPEARACVVGAVREGPFGRWAGLAAGATPTTEPRLVDGTYRAGLRDGTWLAWHDNGLVAELGAYVAGREDGAWKSYRADGTLASERGYAAGLATGAWRTLSPTGVVTSEGAYADGARDGRWVFRSEAGALEREETWAAGRLEGELATYHPDGSERCRGPMHADAREGAWRCLYPGGGLESEGSYAGGLRTGVWSYYERGGALASRGTCVSDELEGTWSVWTSVHWAGPGTWRARDTGLVVHGRLDGAWNAVWELPGEPRQREVTYVDGEREGEERLYWPNGELMLTTTYVGGLAWGASSSYSDAGQLTLEVTYAAARRAGPARAFYESGARRAEGQYRDDWPFGVWRFWSPDGVEAQRDCDAAPCEALCDATGACL